MYDEDDLLPIAALQHLAFCERQWALMYIENIWAENILTTEGKIMHDRVDQPKSETRDGVRLSRGLRLHSLRLGLVGRADLVEFIPIQSANSETGDRHGGGAVLPGVEGLWRVNPVEYKHGRPKPDVCDEVQLCAQALCLEEMLTCGIESGEIYYGRPHQRHPVIFDAALRERTEVLAAKLHEMTLAAVTPAPSYSRKCRSCSLLEVCLPKAIARRRSVQRYLETAFDLSVPSDGDDLP